MYDIYMEGVQGYIMGKRNPYQGGSREAQQWALGYRAERAADLIRQRAIKQLEKKG